MSNDGAAPLVGLIGPAGAGKDTVARLLVEHHGFTRVAFADRIALLLQRIDPAFAALVAAHGGYEPAKRAHPYIRNRMGEVGEAAREVVSPEVWIDPVDLDVQATEGPAVVSDVRKRAEAEWLDDMGGVLLAVSRPGYLNLWGEAVSLWESAPLTIDNDGDLPMLAERVDMIAQDFLL